MRFEKVKLNDIAKVTMGQSPKSEFYSDDDGMPFLQGTRTFGRLYPEIDTYTTKTTKIADENDILFSVRAPVGDINFAPTQLCIGRGLASIKPKEVNEQYLYYLLLGNIKMYESKSTGTIFSSINKKELENLEFEILDLEEQQKIGRFLWSVDQKIELNNSIITNLEELAQTLFERWFVDFEFPNEEGKPYKSSGGKMVESELGMVPEGWSTGSIADIGEVIGGGTPSKKIEEYYCSNGYSWLTPKDLSKNKSIYQYKGELDISELGLKKSSAKLLPKNTILFSSRAPIGYIAIAGKELATNQGFKSIVPFKTYPSEYVYFLLKYLTLTIENNAGGSTFKEISATAMRKVPTILPNADLLIHFKQVISGVFQGIKEKESENVSLTNLRDTLLPKLLSGEIELPNYVEVTDDVPIS